MKTPPNARRYPGAKPFTIEEQDVFFGRQESVRQLYERIQLEPLVVLYGKSGLGKSSLINAGVLPKVEKAREMTPLNIRFGAFTEGETETPLSITLERLRPDTPDSLLQTLLPDDNSLWRSLKTRQRGVISDAGGGDISLAGEETLPSARKISPAHASQMTPSARKISPAHASQMTPSARATGFLLVFDQFEELFTYPPAQVEQFAEQLAELLFTTIPARYRKAMDEALEKNPKAFKTKELSRLAEPFSLCVLMAIRSDRMSLLNRLTDYLPNILKNCFELGALDHPSAEEAILAPAYRPGKQYVSPQFDYTDEALQHILDFLTDGGSDPVESFQLQILCQTVEDKVIEKGLKTVGLAEIGDPRSIYEHYYDNQINRIADPADRLAARRFIEEGLIFEEEERRLSLYEGVIYRQYGISPDLLRQLVDSHLIRAEASITQSGYTYELSHDTLVAPVLKAKARRVAEEKKAAEEREQKRLEAEKERELAMEEAQQKMEEERRKRRRATLIATAGILLALIAGGATFWAFQQTREAVKQKQEAEHARAQAETALLEVKAAQAQLIRYQADGFFSYREYEYALNHYEKALLLTPDDAYLKGKIMECEQILSRPK